MNAVALHANLVSMTAGAADTRWASLRAQAEAFRGDAFRAKLQQEARIEPARQCEADKLQAKELEAVKFVAPRRFVAPRPRWSLSRILSWQEQDELEAPSKASLDEASPTRTVSGFYRMQSVPPQSGVAHNVHQYAGRGGIIGKLLLAAGRRRWENEDSNEAPAWPPASELIACPPNWGKARATDAAVGRAVVLHPVSRSDDGYFPPPGLHAPALGLNLPRATLRSTVSSSHFIGSDGTEWPIPPTECMQASSPSLSPVASDDEPFTTEGDEVHTPSCSPACSSVSSSLPRTPAHKGGSLAQTTKGDCGSRWGVIGEGRPVLVCPQTPLLWSRELVLDSPISSWVADLESQVGSRCDSEFEWSSGSEYDSEEEVWSDVEIASNRG
ncbi:hypothetical protein DICSQDRAFT_178489 [Dichomitus squalens LYAD-421 SS1]|uniref:uncharacterized protein n=1 Tax=Dichomitus squalens (strain LYAD-421) TaxID=732165 RepID=UPI00044153B5|nr:uncharacterized protein DICSQDRAFT_178489 [Dichomitus squalens LYAD-421 SS1]EJF64947.1 hypothetical protein DICSQDRAFT_178489 [Dichomitus squalens LYAD-421 SS1]